MGKSGDCHVCQRGIIVGGEICEFHQLLSDFWVVVFKLCVHENENFGIDGEYQAFFLSLVKRLKS